MTNSLRFRLFRLTCQTQIMSTADNSMGWFASLLYSLIHSHASTHSVIHSSFSSSHDLTMPLFRVPRAGLAYFRQSRGHSLAKKAWKRPWERNGPDCTAQMCQTVSAVMVGGKVQKQSKSFVMFSNCGNSILQIGVSILGRCPDS